MTIYDCYQDIVVNNPDDAEIAAREEVAALDGERIRVPSVDGYLGNDTHVFDAADFGAEYFEVLLAAPSDESSILRWMDGVYIDPVMDVVECRPAPGEGRSLWVYTRSVRLEEG